MRILIAAHGTLGDVLPAAALGRALAARGHDVLLAAPENYAPLAEESGLAFAPAAPRADARIRRAGAASRRLSWQLRLVGEEVIPLQFERIPPLAEGADVIVGSGMQYAAPSVAERMRRPYAGIVYCPASLPTEHIPPSFLRTQRLPRGVNRALWRVGTLLANRAFRGPVNAGRARLGLPPVESFAEHLLSAGPILLAADVVLAPPPPDLPPRVVPCGALVSAPARPLPEDVIAFLAAGPPPVYVGFGSMVADEPERLTRLVLAAAARCGCRLLLGSGWSGLGSGVPELPSWCLRVGTVPHELLFPEVALVVHHGGAGTTTAAFRAGRPQIVVPHLLDQHYWADRVERLGLGPEPLLVEDLSARRLAGRMEAALSDTAMRVRCARVGREALRRDGVPIGAGLVEEIGSAPGVERRRVPRVAQAMRLAWAAAPA